MTQAEALRRYLNQRFSDLNVGWVEEIELLSNDDLWDMVEELEDAQELDIETEQGLGNLQEITSRYLDKE